MRFGIHLPQYGRAADADGITRAALQAEDLGFADVWVSDHLAIPAAAPYPPAFLYEPLITLTWAAAATQRIGLGTSVLVLPYRNPVHLAKELASLDRLSDGRLVVGAAAGWLEGEFDALGVPFAERGRAPMKPSTCCGPAGRARSPSTSPAGSPRSTRCGSSPPPPAMSPSGSAARRPRRCAGR